MAEYQGCVTICCPVSLSSSWGSWDRWYPLPCSRPGVRAVSHSQDLGCSSVACPAGRNSINKNDQCDPTQGPKCGLSSACALQSEQACWEQATSDSEADRRSVLVAVTSARWPLAVWGCILAWCWVPWPGPLLAAGVALGVGSPPRRRMALFPMVTSFQALLGELLVWLLPVCVSLCVLPVVLPYGRLRHAVLPQGRTTDRILGHPLRRRTPRLPSHISPAARDWPP